MTDFDTFTTMLDVAGIKYTVEPLGRELEDWEADTDEYGKLPNDYYWVIFYPHSKGVTGYYDIKFQFNSEGQLIHVWDEP